MASIGDLGSALGKASVGVWGLGLLAYAAAGAIFASLFVGEFGALFKTGLFGIHLFLLGGIGIILFGMGLAQRMGLAGSGEDKTVNLSQRINDAVQQAVDNANNQAEQSSPDIDSINESIKKLGEDLNKLREDMNQRPTTGPNVPPAQPYIINGMNNMGEMLTKLDDVMKKLEGMPTDEQMVILKDIPSMFNELKSSSDETNENVKILRDEVEEIKETLKNIASQVKSTDKAVTKIDNNVQNAFSKLQKLDKRVMLFAKRAKIRDRIINKCVTDTSDDIKSLYKDLRKFWRGRKGAPMLTLASMQERFTDISKYIRILKKEMSNVGVDVSSLKVHLAAYDEIIEGSAVARVEGTDDSLKKGIVDIGIKTHHLGAFINPLAQLFAQKVPTMAAQIAAEKIAKELKDLFTDPIMTNIDNRLLAVKAVLDQGAQSIAAFEPDLQRTEAREQLKKIDNTYLKKIQETQRFMQKYDGIFRDFLEISPEKPTRAEEPDEFKSYIVAYEELEKEMKLTRDALTIGGNNPGAITILKKEVEGVANIKIQLAGAAARVKESLDHYKKWKAAHDDFERKVIKLREDLSRKAVAKLAPVPTPPPAT